jgi:hypothetical protein
VAFIDTSGAVHVAAPDASLLTSLDANPSNQITVLRFRAGRARVLDRDTRNRRKGHASFGSGGRCSDHARRSHQRFRVARPIAVKT